MPKRRREAAPPARDRRAVRLVALAIFAGGLVVRILFWVATPDRAWGWTAYFKGDAPLWLEWARAIELGRSFELGLPIHPPGAAYLVALLWNGHPSGLAFLRFLWVAMGALVPLFVFLGAERLFGLRVATVAGCWTALSTALLVLSTSVNNETPYLVLAVAAIALADGLRDRPTSGRLALWSALNGIACLFRVEHVLFWTVVLAFLAVGWMRRRGASALLRVAASLFFFALPLVPWHLSAWGAIRRFNEVPADEEAVHAVEERFAGLTWTPEARRERDRLPAFARRTGSAFVLATVAHRGGREVRGDDFAILDEAFGYRPERLHRFPFVSSYGALNFALANNGRATGGFDRSPLAEPPPLSGGPSRYPAFLVQGLPPADLAFVYPPHLRLINEGYTVGWKWISEHPADFARLAFRKVSIFWSGAASGLTGWNLPAGLSGPRRPVDMVTPDEGPRATIWQIVILAAGVAGTVVGRRNRALVPWLLFLATRLLVTVAFFGYARQGATVIPVVAVLVGLALERWTPVRAARLAVPVLLFGVTLEAARWIAKPAVSIDDRAIGAADSFGPTDPVLHRVDVSVLRK
jgi:dolichyl-phosphate-mannose-protein mannosyltransferase